MGSSFHSLSNPDKLEAFALTTACRALHTTVNNGMAGAQTDPSDRQSKSDTATPCTTAPQSTVTWDFQTRPLLPGFLPLLCGQAATSAQNANSGSAPACVHHRVILGSPLGLHTWSPPLCNPCRMSGEQVSLLCGALSPLPDMCLHPLSW